MDHPRQPHDCNIQLLKTDELGSGSYGVVCKAMWGQRLCAAKLLHPIFFQSNDPGIVTTRRRFEQECHFLNDMKHPHIVEYLGTSHDPDSGLLVLLMELMDESLTHFLERSQQPLAYHIEVELCHDIAQALAYIHSKEIIHRDLSGNNVLLLAGRAKITDFGMSKLLDSNRRMTRLTMCPGTLVYMPPEALREPPVYSKKIDCFSFGVLQIQIMTRQFPDPGPAMRVVKDSRSPTGTVNMPVLDSERRKSHINLIDPTHTLLPTALGCLSYLEKDRPSAQDLCQWLASVKEAPRYQLQILQQELQTKDQQLQDSQSCMHSLQQANKQLQDTVSQLRRDLQQAVAEKHACERRLREQNQQLLNMPQVGARPHETITPPRPELQQPQEKQHAAEDEQLQPMKRPGPLPDTMFEDQEKTQPRVRHGPQRIEDSEIIIQGFLGAGTFGTVRGGLYRPKTGEPEVKCAIKYLEPAEELPNQKSEILREADAMAMLDHANIVRLYGICVTNPIRLVMEIAPLGPLNKFLRRHPSFPILKIMNMMVQVAQGMEYLEQTRFVHRDLAARNVLVVDEENVKISDFGMSRAIGAGSEYYRAETAGRWPLKWYAPECIYYAKFDSKSDVWSYGVTVWEAFSYGSKPYSGMKGQDIMQMLEHNQRLDSPDKCPQPAYDIMLRCWSWRPEDRPTFAELASQVKDIATYMQQEQHHPPVQQPSAQIPVRPPRPAPAPAPRPERRNRT